MPGIPPPLELGPGDSELFEVAVSTNDSDPRSTVSTGEPEVARTGGTRAYFEFVPWAIATEADGTRRTVRTDPQTDQDRGVKISEEHRELTASIDDSIAIPETEWDMLAGGISLGVAKGIGRAGVGLVTGAVETRKLPFTLTIGAMEYQSRVWNAFTEEERRLYSEEFSTYLIAMAVGNVENGLRDADQLKDAPGPRDGRGRSPVPGQRERDRRNPRVRSWGQLRSTGPAHRPRFGTEYARGHVHQGDLSEVRPGLVVGLRIPR